jgi:hypothetical protein
VDVAHAKIGLRDTVNGQILAEPTGCILRLIVKTPMGITAKILSASDDETLLGMIRPRISPVSSSSD